MPLADVTVDVPVERQRPEALPVPDQLPSPVRKAALGGRLLWNLAWRVPDLTRHWRFPKAAERLLDGLQAGEGVSAAAYEDLLRYFVTGWRSYRTALGAGADYPGLPSWSGRQADRLEGFARIMPLFAAWHASGRSDEVMLDDGAVLRLSDEFKRGLLSGTDPDSPEYWGAMPGKSNQRIVEAADVALALWLFRDAVWNELSESQRNQVVAWLAQLDGRPGLDNNWHLFFVLVDRVLASFGHPGRIGDTRSRFRRIKDFHLGEGWFKDGPRGRVDYYNAWAFHYALYWIDRIDPQWDPGFISECQRSFIATYRYVMAPHGLPILGRSICYRMAAAAPLVLGQERHGDIVSPGEARRALDCHWKHFSKHGAIRHGVPTQGYWKADPRVLDPYSGPASSLWSLRSLVAAFQYPEASPFWRSAGSPLPVEQGDYSVTLGAANWRVHGTRATGEVAVEVMTNDHGAAPALKPVPRLYALRRLVDGTAPAHANTEAKYGRRLYRSNPPFCVDGHGEPRLASRSAAI